MCNMHRMTIRFEDTNDTHEGEMNELQELETYHGERLNRMNEILGSVEEEMSAQMRVYLKYKDEKESLENKLSSLREKMGKPQCCDKCGACLEENEGDTNE